LKRKPASFGGEQPKPFPFLTIPKEFFDDHCFRSKHVFLHWRLHAKFVAATLAGQTNFALPGPVYGKAQKREEPMFERNKTPKSRAPDETVRVSPNLQTQVWSVLGMHDREHRLHFRLERITPEGRTLRTMRPENLLEIPQAVSLLAGGFAKVGSLPQALRDSLKHLASLLEKVHTELSTNGSAVGSPNDEEAIFGR